MKFERILYNELNKRQKENYNFQKMAAKLADYGYNCMWLNDDWEGADFIACHINGSDFLKVQLKGCFSLAQKYTGKEIYIAFRMDEQYWIYPHDTAVKDVVDSDDIVKGIKGTKSWEEGEKDYPIPNPPTKKLLEYLQQYSI